MKWLIDNWVFVAIVTVYVIVNVAPRPHPDDHTGWQRILWLVLDRIAFLTADAVPGKFKFFFGGTPREEPAPETPVTPRSPVARKDDDAR